MKAEGFDVADRELTAVGTIIDQYTRYGEDNKLQVWTVGRATPRREEHDPPLNAYATYAADQRRLFANIMESALDGFARWRESVQKRRRNGEIVVDPTAVSLFLTGSASKFEFFEDSSDVDFLPILHTGDAIATSPDFDDLMQQLAAALMSRGLISSPDRVNLSGAINRGAKEFLTPNDLIYDSERENEPSWLASFRAQLLTEARPIKTVPKCSALLTKTRKHYATVMDLAAGLYPLLSSRLLLAFSISGVLGQAMPLRPLRASKKRRKSEIPDEDTRVIKAVISRDWNAAINLLTLHIFYWISAVDKDGRRWSAEQITGALCAAPLHQLCVTCTESLKDLLQGSTREKLSKRMLGLGISQENLQKIVGSQPELDRYDIFSTPPADALVNYEGGILQELYEHLSPGVSTGDKPSLGDRDQQAKPLWMAYLDAMRLYKRVRSGTRLDEGDIDSLMTWTRRFNAVLGMANEVTRVILDHDMSDQLKADATTLNGYKKLARWCTASRLLS